MTVMLADYDPGTLTGFSILLLAGLGVAFCLALAGILALGKERRVARAFLIAAGVIVCAAILFACLAVALGKRLHLV